MMSSISSVKGSLTHSLFVSLLPTMSFFKLIIFRL